MKKVLALLIIFQLLFNSVWASSHMSEDEHGVLEAPHVHIDAHYEAPAAENPELTQSHDVECHIHIFLFVSNGVPVQIEQAFYNPPLHKDSSFPSLLLTPPVPPPNA